jgi:hypothetical protein
MYGIYNGGKLMVRTQIYLTEEERTASKKIILSSISVSEPGFAGLKDDQDGDKKR